jgi:hypothetical protein
MYQNLIGGSLLTPSHFSNYMASTAPMATHTSAKASELTITGKYYYSLTNRRLLRKPVNDSTRKKPAVKGKSSQE